MQTIAQVPGFFVYEDSLTYMQFGAVDAVDFAIWLRTFQTFPGASSAALVSECKVYRDLFSCAVLSYITLLRPLTVYCSASKVWQKKCKSLASKSCNHHFYVDNRSHLYRLSHRLTPRLNVGVESEDECTGRNHCHLHHVKQFSP